MTFDGKTDVMIHAGLLGIAALALALNTPSALAQGAQAPATPSAPVGAEPAVTTATYGDWVLRCQSGGVAGAPRRLCEVVQTMQMQGQAEPVAQVAFGKAEGTGDLHLVVALPVNVSFPSAVVISAGDKDPRPLTLEWKRCIPGACFADGVMSADTMARWRVTTTGGRVQYKDASGRELALPLSFRGMAQALDALNKAQ